MSYFGIGVLFRVGWKRQIDGFHWFRWVLFHLPGVLFACFGRQVDAFPWFTWWFVPSTRVIHLFATQKNTYDQRCIPCFFFVPVLPSNSILGSVSQGLW